MPQYWLVSTSPANFEVSKQNGFTVEGFKERIKKLVQRVQPGDRFLYYINKLQKIGAISEATSGYYYDNKTKIWIEEDEIWPCRFTVKPYLVLPEEEFVDVKKLVDKLSFITDKQREVNWGLAFRGSLRAIPKEDYDLFESEMKKILRREPKKDDVSPEVSEEEAKKAIMTLPLESNSLHDRLGEMLETVGSWMEYNAHTRHRISPEHSKELDVAWLKGKNPQVAVEVQIGGNITEAVQKLREAKNFNYRKVIMVIEESQIADLNKEVKFDPTFKNWLEAWSIASVYRLYTSGRSFFNLYEKLEESRYKEKAEVEFIR